MHQPNRKTTDIETEMKKSISFLKEVTSPVLGILKVVFSFDYFPH